MKQSRMNNNYVAKHAYKQNRAEVFRDKKSDYQRAEKHRGRSHSLADYLAEID